MVNEDAVAAEMYLLKTTAMVEDNIGKKNT